MNSVCKALTLVVWLAANPWITHQAAAAESTTKHNTTTNRYAGYQVDGKTSASVLAAKRSHTVSESDETALAVFSGILAIGAIFFLVQLLQKTK